MSHGPAEGSEPSGPSEEMFLQSTGVGARRETDMQSFQPLATSSWKRLPHHLCHPVELRISYTLHQPTATYAAFFKESRTRFTDATKTDRKSGGSRGTCCAPFPNATAQVCHRPQLGPSRYLFQPRIAGSAFFKPIAWRQPPLRGWLAGSPTGGQDSLDSAHSLHRIWHSQDRCALQGRRRPRRRRPPPGLAPE